MNPADLELTSLLVPSADMARQGDLLVSSDENGNIEDIAFIVQMPSTKEDDTVTDFWTGVKVVSVKRVFKRVTLGVWGLDEGIRANGFTQDPSRYQIRRLLTKRESSSSGEGTVQWEAVDNLPAHLDYAINFDLNPSQATPETLGNDNLTDFFLEWGEHFVPNTTEPLRLDSLEFTLTDAAGQEISYFQEAGQRVPVELAPPKDPYYDTEKSDSGNVYNNTGDGIDFGYVYWKENKPDTPYIQRLVTMKQGASGTYTMTKDTETSGDLYLEYDTQKDKYILKYEYQEDEKFVVTKEFYVGALQASDGASRPGDDFLLNFRLADYPDVQTKKEDDDINFLAVYDKKMLWRANLYIAEEKNDWNDLHPWIGTTEELNEWNKEYDGVTWGASPANGGQVVTLQTYTPVRSKDKNDWTENYYNDRVAYDYPVGNALALDSPFDFVYKLHIQKENLEDYYTKNPESELPYPLNDITTEVLQNWGKTRGPNNRWQNYTTVPSGDSLAYLPGLGLYEHTPNHSARETGLLSVFSSSTYNQSESAGVDCLGFAQRAASFNGNYYKWIDFPDESAEGGGIPEDGDDREFTNLINNKSYFIVDFDSFEDEIMTLKLIKPGDIVHYGTDHIGIIQEIDQVNDNNNPNKIIEKIRIIESYYDGEANYVAKDRFILNLQDKDKEWKVIRLEGK